MLIQRYLRAPEHTSFNTKNRRMHPHVDTRMYMYVCVYQHAFPARPSPSVPAYHIHRWIRSSRWHTSALRLCFLYVMLFRPCVQGSVPSTLSNTGTLPTTHIPPSVNSK